MEMPQVPNHVPHQSHTDPSPSSHTTSMLAPWIPPPSIFLQEIDMSSAAQAPSWDPCHHKDSGLGQGTGCGVGSQSSRLPGDGGHVACGFCGPAKSWVSGTVSGEGAPGYKAYMPWLGL